jgi:AcrR family transcriptional regulator
MPRPARVSPDRILAAAAAEFAERGFAGARVDRIARRARVNKAMLYYHFHSKKALYRALLLDAFTHAAALFDRIAAEPVAPAEKIDRAIAALARLIDERPVLPAIMMREVADRGVHLDPETLQALGAVPRAFAALVQQGVASGDFRPIHPVFAYFTMLPPLLFFLAAAPIRRQVSELAVMNLHGITAAEFVAALQDMARRSFTGGSAGPSRASR